MMKRSVISLTVAAAVCTVGPAFAQPAPGAPSMAPDYAPSAAVQPQGEGQGPGRGRPMTLAEFQARFRDRLMRADTDHDGRISQAEFMAARQAGGQGHGDPVRQFEMMDANHDGYITPAEIDAVSAARFARMDVNHDGVVTADERMAARHGGVGGGAVQPLPPPQ